MVTPSAAGTGRPDEGCDVRKILIGAVAAAACGVATYFLVELFTTDRQRVTRVVRRLAGRLESRDPAGFCLLLTEDYKDSAGHDRAALRARLVWGLPQLRSLSVAIEDLDVQVTGDTATAEFLGRTVAKGQTQSGVPPWRWQTRVRLKLRKVEGGWRVQEAEFRLPPIVGREAF